MKKTKKALASLAIAGMLATMVPFNALAAVPEMGTRIAGYTAYETAQQISLQTESATSVVLAAGMTRNSVDALAAGPLAAQLNAPILLTDGDGTLTAEAKAELTRLMPKKVYVTSGTAVILPAALAEVEAITGVGTVVALGGFDAYETSLKIAQQMVALGAAPTGIVIAGGWASPADALSAASIAAAKGMPILAVAKDGLSAAQKAFVASLTGVTKSYVVGGTAVIDATVDATLPGVVTRLAGQTQYDTNLKVLQQFTDVNYGKVFVANGRTFVDALAGAPLAAKYDAAIVLADGVIDPSLATFVKSKMSATSKVIALGGTAAVPQSIIDTVNGVVPGALTVTSVSATGAKELTVKFSKAVDSTLAVVTVKKGGVTLNVASTTFADDKTSAVVELSGKITKGDYTVTVSGLTETALTGTVTAADETVAKIDLASNAIWTSATTAIAYYHVYNQYDEEITKTSSLTAATSASAGVGLTASTGVALMTFGAVKVGDSVSLTLIDTDSAVSVSKTLEVADKAGAKELTIDTLYNADAKTLNEDSTVGDFKLVISAKDQYGNKLNTAAVQADLLVTVGDITVVSVNAYNSAASTATFTTTKIDGTDRVTLALAGGLKAGTSKITLISKTTGKITTFDVVVKDGVVTDTIALTAPDVSAVGEDAVVQVDATDMNGDAINKVAEFAGTTVNVTSTAGASAAVANAFKLNPTTNKVELVIPAVNLGAAKGKATITVMSEENKVTILQLDVKEAAVPTAFVGFKTTSDVVPNLYISGTVAIQTDDIIVEDQYGRVLKQSKIDSLLGTDANTTAANAGKFVIAFESDSASVVVTPNLTTTETTATGGGFTASDATVTFTAAGTKGSATITAKIYKGAAVTGTYGLVVGSNFDYAMGVKDKTQIVSYEVKDLGSIYDDAAAGYAKTVKVYGVLSNGTKVRIPSSLFTVTTDKAGVTVAADVIDVTAAVVSAVDHKDVTVNLSVIVDADASTVSLTAPVVVSDAAPKAVDLKIASLGGLTVDGSGVTGVVADVTIAKLRALVKTVDQYGTEDLATVGANNPTFSFTNKSTGSTLAITGNGTAGAVIATAPTVGDSFDVTLAYGTKSVTFKVVVK